MRARAQSKLLLLFAVMGLTACELVGRDPATTSAAVNSPGATWETVVAGHDHTVALKTDNTLWTWCYNGYGQLGDGTTVDRHSPAQIGTNFVAVAAGSYHTVALKKDGTLWAWGQNVHGQVGDTTTTDRHSPVLVGNGFTAPSLPT